MGRTEVIKNDLNPKFIHSFEVDYYFEQVQKVRFAIYDIDNSSASLNDDDFLGSYECTVGEVFQFLFKFHLYFNYFINIIFIIQGSFKQPFNEAIGEKK